MKYEKSCGAIIFDGDKVLILQQTAGHWGFPKGHVEDGETEVETEYIGKERLNGGGDWRIESGFKNQITSYPCVYL